MRARLEAIEDRVKAACQVSGRERVAVTLIAVSKTQSVEAIRELYDLGVRDFGESRWQEAEPKMEALPEDIRWHFIGTLQSNKTRRIGERFSAIHSLSSPSQLKELVKVPPVPTLIEVNIGNEPQKAGVSTENLAEFHKSVIQYNTVDFRGLMAIGPAHLSAEAMRPYFQRLRELNESIGGTWLSMGMSQDFDVAIQEGATHVRVGTALFGKRT